jgi:hypothetical protein
MMTSVGVLQRDAGRIPLDEATAIVPPLSAEEEAKGKEANEQILPWAQDIVSQMLLVDLLIKHLPGISESETEQMRNLEALQKRNEESGKHVLERTARLEEKLAQVRSSLRFIVEDQQSATIDSDVEMQES